MRTPKRMLDDATSEFTDRVTEQVGEFSTRFHMSVESARNTLVAVGVIAVAALVLAIVALRK